MFFDLHVVGLVSSALRELSQMAFGLHQRGGDPQISQSAALEDQLAWLRSAGFADVDCFL